MKYEEFSRWITTYAFIGWVLSHSCLSHKELAELAEEDGNKMSVLIEKATKTVVGDETYKQIMAQFIDELNADMYANNSWFREIVDDGALIRPPEEGEEE